MPVGADPVGDNSGSTAVAIDGRLGQREGLFDTGKSKVVPSNYQLCSSVEFDQYSVT